MKQILTLFNWLCRIARRKSDSKIKKLLLHSNVSASLKNPLATWRWPGPSIDVFVDQSALSSRAAEIQANLTTAIETINRKLGSHLNLVMVNSHPRGKAITVAFGAAYIPEDKRQGDAKVFESYRANVAQAPFQGEPILPGRNSSIDSNVFINLGHMRCVNRAPCQCDLSPNIIIHEFGHALGLQEHFPGFGGDGPPISDAFWDVLTTLYGNPPGTDADNLEVVRSL